MGSVGSVGSVGRVGRCGRCGEFGEFGEFGSLGVWEDEIMPNPIKLHDHRKDLESPVGQARRLSAMPGRKFRKKSPTGYLTFWGD